MRVLSWKGPSGVVLDGFFLPWKVCDTNTEIRLDRHSKAGYIGMQGKDGNHE